MVENRIAARQPQHAAKTPSRAPGNSSPQVAGLLKEIGCELEQRALATANSIVQIYGEISYISQALKSAGYRDHSTRWESIQNDFADVVSGVDSIARQGHLLLADILETILVYLQSDDSDANKLDEVQTLVRPLNEVSERVKKLNPTLVTIHQTIGQLANDWSRDNSEISRRIRKVAGDVKRLVSGESRDVRKKAKIGIAKALAVFLSPSIYQKLLLRIGGGTGSEGRQQREILSTNMSVTDLITFLDIREMLFEDVGQMQRNYSDNAKDRASFEFTMELYKCLSEVQTKFADACSKAPNRHSKTEEKRRGGFFAIFKRFFGV